MHEASRSVSRFFAVLRCTSATKTTSTGCKYCRIRILVNQNKFYSGQGFWTLRDEVVRKEWQRIRGKTETFLRLHTDTRWGYSSTI